MLDIILLRQLYSTPKLKKKHTFDAVPGKNQLTCSKCIEAILYYL